MKPGGSNKSNTNGADGRVCMDIHPIVDERYHYLFKEVLIQANDDMNRYTRIVTREIWRALVGDLGVAFTSRKLDALPVSKQAEPFFDWMMSFLLFNGDLEREDDRFCLRSIASLPDRESARKIALDRFDGRTVPAYKLVDRCADAALDFICKKIAGNEVLFESGTPTLWLNYFNNDNPLYAVNNRLAAMVLAEELAASGGERIMEFGGGGGSGALAFVDESRRWESLACCTYAFTEPAEPLRQHGFAQLKEQAPEEWSIEAKNIDLNYSLKNQGVDQEQWDAVFAVNTLHVIRNLDKTLRDLRGVLRPGGTLVLGECIRPRQGQPMYPEFIFNFLPEFYTVHKGLNRSTHGFLTPNEWRRSLLTAGFGDVRIIPDINWLSKLYPNCFTAAIVASAP